MAYMVSGIDPALFIPLYGLSDRALEERGAIRRTVEPGDAIPERIELRDAPAGSTVLLVNYVHQPADNPYRASHAVFVREGAVAAASVRDAVPDVLARRLVSLRAFDRSDMLAAADVRPGADLEPLILDYLSRPEVAYLHAHFAKQGCFAALIRRS